MRPDQQHGLGRDIFDGASVLCLPACLELHRRVDERVVDTCRDVHVVDVRLLLEVGDDALDLVELEVAGPERGRVDPVADERLVADRLPDSPERLDRKPQAVLVRATLAVAAPVVERRDELPRQVPVAHVQLHSVEARLDRPRCCRGERVEDLLDLLLR